MTIIGRKENIAAAKKALLERVTQIENTVEETTEVDRELYRDIIRSQLLKDLSNEFENVAVHLPRDDEEGNAVSVKGPKEDVAQVIARLQQYVSDIKTRVTIEVAVERDLIPSILGQGGKNIRQISEEFKVNIQLPKLRGGKGGKKSASTASAGDAEPAAAAAAAEANGNGNGEAAATDEAAAPADGENEVVAPGTAPAANDVITITGQPGPCESARQAIQALIPISEEVPVELVFHRLLIGTKGEGVRKLSDENNVRIKIPKPEENKPFITIRGLAPNIAKTKERLKERLVELEDLRKKQFKLEVDVDAKYHSSLIGAKGANINKIRNDFDVQIDMPRGGDKPNTITLTGYEQDCAAARDDILAKVAELSTHVTQEIVIDPRIRPRIIGAGGKGMQGLQDKYGVRLTFPRDKPDEPVLVQGPEGNVADCLLELEDQIAEFVSGGDNSLLFSFVFLFFSFLFFLSVVFLLSLFSFSLLFLSSLSSLFFSVSHFFSS